MRITTTTVQVPPLVHQYFNRDLLSRPFKMGEDEKDLWEICEYIQKKLWKKLNRCEVRKKKCQAILDEFMEIYERIEKKKKEPKTEEKNKTDGLFYSIRTSKPGSEQLFFRLKRKASSHSSDTRKNNAIQKV